MKKITILFACSAIACMAINSGCSKGVSEHVGEAINFSAISSGSVATKTIYGEKLFGTKIPLNWVDGDVITIGSPQSVVQDGANAGSHLSNYVIKESTEGVPSIARVNNEGTNGLVWTDEVETFDFYAVYPKNGDDITMLQDGSVTATIPALQPLVGEATTKTVTSADAGAAAEITYNVYQPDMTKAFMTAVTKGVKHTDASNAVSLEFKPAFTAFEFNVTTLDGSVDLTEFELLSPAGRTDKIAGTFTMTAGDLTSVTPGNVTGSIKVDMSNKPQAVTDTKGLTFTVFSLPIANKEPLRIRFTSREGENGTKTSWVDLKYGEKATTGKPGEPVVFEAGHKYRINMLKLPSSQWKISIVPIFEEWVAGEEVVIYI